MKTVSVIIPCYNGEHVIERAISSVFSQDYPSVELIVVDDGSMDRSKEKILSWKADFDKKGWHLNYFYQKNKGLGGAINAGLKLVTGDYISLLDADDEYLPGAISERADFLDAHPQYDAVRSNGWVVKATSKYLFVYEKDDKERTDVFEAMLRGETNNWAGSYLVRSEPLFRFYPDREIYTSRYGQNLQLLLPLIYKKSCGFIDKPFMNYIQQGDSLSQTTDKAKAKSLDLKNSEGYRDIRVYMTELIVSEPNERQKYLAMIEAGYWRGVMKIAIIHNDKKLLKDAYKSLAKTEKPTVMDKISYYEQVCPLIAYGLRAWKKAGSIVRGS